MKSKFFYIALVSAGLQILPASAMDSEIADFKEKESAPTFTPKFATEDSTDFLTIELLHNPFFVVSKEFLTPLPFILSVGAQHRSRRINISPFDFGPYGTYAQGERQKVMQEL